MHLLMGIKVTKLYAHVEKHKFFSKNKKYNGTALICDKFSD